MWEYVALAVLVLIAIPVVGSFIWFSRASASLRRHGAALLKERLKAEHGTAYDLGEAKREFKFIGVLNPCKFASKMELEDDGTGIILLTRRSDGKIGSLLFRNEPRLYFRLQISSVLIWKDRVVALGELFPKMPPQFWLGMP